MTASSGRVVMLSYYHPPLAGIASERSAAFARHLPSAGWEPTVIAPATGHYHRVADEDAAPEPTRVRRTNNPEISRLLRRIHGGQTTVTADTGAEIIEPARIGTLGRRVRRLVHDTLYVPDAQVAWIPFVARAAVEEIERASDGAPTVLYSSSVPYSSHLAARWAARRTGVPWVAEFRDPWVTMNDGDRRGFARRWLDQRMHADILRSATRIVYTAETTRHAVLKQFPWLDPDKTVVVRNGFEPTPAGIAPSRDEPFVLVYAGTVETSIPLSPLLEALRRTVLRARARITLRIVGPEERWRAAAKAAGPLDGVAIEYRGLVDPAEARREMAASSANLIVAPRAEDKAIVPGKLYEYLGVRRPLLCLIPVGSEMADVASYYGDARVVYRNEPLAIVPVLAALVEEHRAGSLQGPRAAESMLEPITRRHLATELADVFRAAAGAA